jgi:hypothetical protein
MMKKETAARKETTGGDDVNCGARAASGDIDSIKFSSATRPPAVRIFVEPLHGGARGRARLGSPAGPVIVENSTEPFLAAARKLLAQGITGTAEKWRMGDSFPSMRGDIAEMALWTVEEGDTPPRFRRWRPYEGGRGSSNPAVSGEKLAFEPLELPAGGEGTAAS